MGVRFTPAVNSRCIGLGMIVLGPTEETSAARNRIIPITKTTKGKLHRGAARTCELYGRIRLGLLSGKSASPSTSQPITRCHKVLDMHDIST